MDIKYNLGLHRKNIVCTVLFVQKKKFGRLDQILNIIIYESANDGWSNFLFDKIYIFTIFTQKFIKKI